MSKKHISEVKAVLSSFQSEEKIGEWELPYENTLTRLDAAIFFVSPKQGIPIEPLWTSLSKFENFAYRPNSGSKLSKLSYRVTFAPDNGVRA